MPRTNRTKITQRMLDALRPVTKETWTMDSEVIGLGVRQRPETVPVWYIRFRKPSDGRDMKYKIGSVDQVTLEYARKIAIQRMSEVAEKGEIEDKRLLEKMRVTVSEWIEQQLEDMQAKGRSATYIRDFRSQCRTYVEPSIGTMLVRDVTSNEVDRLLAKIRNKGPLHNRVRSNLSRLFSAAIRARIMLNNPVYGAEKAQESARTRVLDDSEMDRLQAALDAHPCMEADAVRLLYLTGSRPKELLQSRWEDFAIPDDLSKSVIWTKPAQLVKQRRTHEVPLSSLAGAVIRRMKEAAPNADEGDYVFPSRKGKGKHLTELKDFWATICREAKLENARPYDLRKSFATRVLAATDIKTAMSLTGHTQPGVFLRHYAQLVKGKQEEALERVKW